MLEDIAVLTGGTVVSEEMGMKLETTDLSALGTASKIVIDKDNTPYRDWETDRKSTRLNSSHRSLSRMPSSA